MRCDAVGLKAGNYLLKVVPYVGSDERTDLQAVSSSLAVTADVREGFAFSSNSTYKTGVGAYNNDGTLKTGAQVIYVTSATAKTVSLSVKTSSSGSTVCTGLQAIMDARQKGYDTTPLDVRVVGTIFAANMDSFSSSEEGLQIKGNKSYSEMNITLEGIGNDATLHGFGLLIKNCGSVEIKNLGFLKFMDDGISLDTDNCNVWVHNNDFYYGTPGSASDQVKGDGTVDLKADSTFITISYNHFYDSGKSSLCGMKSEVNTSYVTYHHNWFDHSDSRHPRIRTITVHAYNNYFDGNSKYGVGVTMGASAFVEGNYFNNCKYPMLISQQGSDIATDTKGTFSGETGGVIKAYNNTIIGATGLVYANAETGTAGATGASSTTQFDAYLATSRDETVASTYAARLGATTYNNFDTNSSLMYSYTPTATADVPTNVKAHAGRLQGGDLPYTFTTADDTSYAIDTVLQALVFNYQPTVLLVGGTLTTGGGSSSSTTSTSTGSTSSTTSSSSSSTSTVVSSSDLICNFTDLGTFVLNTPQTCGIFTVNANSKSGPDSKTYESVTYTKAIKLESDTEITFTATASGTLYILEDVLSNTKAIKVNGTAVTSDANGLVTVSLTAGSTYSIKKGNTAIIYLMKVVY